MVYSRRRFCEMAKANAKNAREFIKEYPEFVDFYGHTEIPGYDAKMTEYADEYFDLFPEGADEGPLKKKQAFSNTMHPIVHGMRQKRGEEPSGRTSSNSDPISKAFSYVQSAINALKGTEFENAGVTETLYDALDALDSFKLDLD